MEGIKLSDGVFEQLKEIEQMEDFNSKYLTKEQELLIDKLILDEELKERYKSYGLCYKLINAIISTSPFWEILLKLFTIT